MFLFVFGIFVLLAFAILGFSVKAKTSASKKYLIIEGETFKIEIADTIQSHGRGLSGRAGLGADEGMYFVFPFRARYGFWMKGMKFPIDIVWIKNNSILGF